MCSLHQEIPENNTSGFLLEQVPSRINMMFVGYNFARQILLATRVFVTA